MLMKILYCLCLPSFIDGFTLEMRSQSIYCLLSGSACMYWILDPESELHSIWDLWTSALQECKAFFLFRKLGGVGSTSRSGSKNIYYYYCCCFLEACPGPHRPPPK